MINKGIIQRKSESALSKTDQIVYALRMDFNTEVI